MGNADPVFQKKGGSWWHYDETWSEEYGPFSSREEANAACAQYARWLDGVDSLQQLK